MEAALDRQTIYFGAQALLVVEVADPTASEWPVVTPANEVQITRYGSPSTVRDLFSGSVRQTFRFVINPARPGQFNIGPVTLGSGAAALTRGPFTLHVVEAPWQFLSAQVDPQEIRVGEKATLTIRYQGVRRGKDLELPAINGVALRSLGLQRVDISRPEGMPISTYQVEVTPGRLGAYEIKGISLDGAAAGPATLKASPFVVVEARVGEQSLVVGGQTTVALTIRGLTQSAGIKLVAPAGLRIQPGRSPYASTNGAMVFQFEVTATEPGTPTITSLQLTDGTVAALPRPIAISVRSSGAGDILAARGSARSAETVVGEAFIADYEVFFRGDLVAAGIDLSQAEFASRPYVKVEPVGDLSYAGWTGQRIEVGTSGNGRALMLSGSGDLNGKREQLLRFALRITPLAVGELDLKGVRVIVRLQIKEEQRSVGMFYSSTQMRDFSRSIDVPAHRVTDPPGKRAPAGYRGAVGTSLTYTTALDRTTATAMSPLTLTLKIAGPGVGPQFKPPPLVEIPELTRDFDVSSTLGGGEVQGDKITFTQVIRPRSETVKELPALPLVYYNYVKKDYETVYSLPIPISVSPGSLVGATAMQTRAGLEANPAPEARAQAGPAGEIVSLGANYTTLGELEAGPPLGTGGVVAVLLGGPGAILAAWASLRWRERRRPAASIRRQRRELMATLERVGGKENFYADLANLVQDCLRLTFGLPAGELSAEMLERAMSERGLDGGLRKQVEELLACCDTGRFAAAGVEAAERGRLVERARVVFEELDRV